MQCLPVDVYPASTVQIVPRQGISPVRHMYTDLVRPTGFQAKGQKRVAL